MQKTELYAIGEVRNRGQMSLRWRLIKFLDGVFGRRKTRTRSVKPGDIVHLSPSEGAESLNGRLREMEEAKLRVYTVKAKTYRCGSEGGRPTSPRQSTTSRKDEDSSSELLSSRWD